MTIGIRSQGNAVMLLNDCTGQLKFVWTGLPWPGLRSAKEDIDALFSRHFGAETKNVFDKMCRHFPVLSAESNMGRYTEATFDISRAIDACKEKAK